MSRLIDENGNDISGYDVQGEMCVKGPTIVSGYYNNPKANAEAYDSDGWFKTGDVCYCDGKTKLWYIVDRKKVGREIHNWCISYRVMVADGRYHSRNSSKSEASKSHRQNLKACYCLTPTSSTQPSSAFGFRAITPSRNILVPTL
jgi:acyl-CoA synthetase (AMP-forming)/AMP-acid ligase II